MAEDDGHRREKWIRIRMGIIGAMIAIGLVAVVGRVYYLQTVQRDSLHQKSDEQTSDEVTLKASRGNILDRNGVELAVTTDVPSIYARPPKIERPRREARRLSPHLNLGFEAVVEKLSSDDSFVWLERQTKPASAEAIAKLEIPGVNSVTEHKRYYPLGSRAGHLLGFVGIDGHGLEGVERMLDDTLSGGDYKLIGTRDATGRTLLTDNVPDLSKLQGNSVALTIDERIQRVAQEALDEQVEKYDAKAGYGVVMDVETGELLALANTPKFDPNRFQEFTSQDWRLRTVTDTFEPGSVFKPFVLAGALEENTVSLQSTFDCEDGAIRIGKHTVRDTHAYEKLTAAEIIQKSSNIGAYKIAQTLGRDRFYDYIRDFGFGSRTGLGIRGEQAGLVWPPDRWAEVSFANIAFGQGISATPLQVATAMAAIANDGMLLEPRIVSEVRGPDGGVVRKTEPELVRRVVSKGTARKVAEAMSLVTLEEGTGTNAALEDYTVAGKTGTAQKVDPETHAYADKWVGSFIGFVPAEDPKFLISIMIDEPKEQNYGGIVAAPAFHRIAKKSLAYRGIMPVPESERFDLESDDEDETETEDDESDDQPRAEENSTERATTDKRAKAETETEEGTVDPDDADGAVPDFRGLTLRAALRKASKSGLSPEVEGWGQVVSQQPRPGRPVDRGDELRLVLSPQRRVGPATDSAASGAGTTEP